MTPRPFARAGPWLLAAIVAPAIAQQTPPPPPTSATVQPQRTQELDGLAELVAVDHRPAHIELAEAAGMIREGQYTTALAKIDDVLATDAKNPQARFLKGVVQSDRDETDAAIVTFQQLTEDYPELPEPYNNLAVSWAKKGEYEKARKALETAPLPVVDGLDPKSKAVPLRFSVPLAELPNGQYECQVTVLDTTSQKAAFWRAPVVLVP